MPIYKRPEKEVIITDHIESVLQSYADALLKENLILKSTSDRTYNRVVENSFPLELTPAPKTLRPGAFAKVKQGVEVAFDTNLGGSRVKLPVISYSVHEDLNVFLESYIDNWTNKLQNAKLPNIVGSKNFNSKQIVENKITDPHILISELLKRLIIFIASEHNTELDYTRYFNAIRGFITSITSTESPYIFNNNQYNSIGNYLKQEHHIQLNDLEKIIECRKTLESHIKSFKAAENLLSQLIKLIKCQLIAYWDPKIDQAALADDVYRGTLTGLEEEIYNKASDSWTEAKKELIEKNIDKNIDKTQAICLYATTSTRKYHEKITELYKVLDEVNKAKQLVSNLCKFIEFSSWVGLIASKLDMRTLSLKINELLDKNKVTLDASNVLKEKDNAHTALSINNAHNISIIQRNACTITSRIYELSDQTLLQYITDDFKTNIDAILTAQNALNWRILSEEKMKKLFGSKQNSNKLESANNNNIVYTNLPGVPDSSLLIGSSSINSDYSSEGDNMKKADSNAPASLNLFARARETMKMSSSKTSTAQKAPVNTPAGNSRTSDTELLEHVELHAITAPSTQATATPSAQPAPTPSAQPAPAPSAQPAPAPSAQPAPAPSAQAEPAPSPPNSQAGTILTANDLFSIFARASKQLSLSRYEELEATVLKSSGNFIKKENSDVPTQLKYCLNELRNSDGENLLDFALAAESNPLKEQIFWLLEKGVSVFSVNPATNKSSLELSAKYIVIDAHKEIYFKLCGHAHKETSPKTDGLTQYKILHELCDLVLTALHKKLAEYVLTQKTRMDSYLYYYLRRLASIVNRDHTVLRAKELAKTYEYIFNIQIHQSYSALAVHLQDTLNSYQSTSNSMLHTIIREALNTYTEITKSKKDEIAQEIGTYRHENKHSFFSHIQTKVDRIEQEGLSRDQANREWRCEVEKNINSQVEQLETDRKKFAAEREQELLERKKFEAKREQETLEYQKFLATREQSELKIERKLEQLSMLQGELEKLVKMQGQLSKKSDVTSDNTDSCDNTQSYSI